MVARFAAIVSFLFPLYLLGALAIAIPIALHLRRRPTRDRIEFSSTLFLDPADPPQRRSSRIEHWLLLALRCAALLLLAMLFCRPLWRGMGDRVQASGTIRIVLLDRSASMRQTGAWEAAVREVRQLASTAVSTGDRLAFAVFEREFDLLVPFAMTTEAGTAVDAALKGLGPSWSGTALDEALIQAAGLVEEQARSQRANQEIVLISDFQEGAARDRLQAFAWPGAVRLRTIPVVTNPKENASLQVVAAVEEDDEADRQGPRPEAIRLRVSRSAGSGDQTLTVRWKEAPESTLEIRLAPGASRVLAAPPRPSAEATELELVGDAEPFDNRAFVAPRRARTVRVLFAGETVDPANTEAPLFFLNSSLGATPNLRPEVTARRVGELSAPDWEKADVAVIAANLPDAAAQELRRFVDLGGLAVVLLPDAAAGAWLQSSGFAVSEANAKDYALLEGIDFEHPVFRPFATPGLRDFSKVRTWKHRRITIPETARALAKFDSGDPALIEWPSGKGRLLVWAMDWVPRDTQLPLSSKFVPLIYAILGEAGFRHSEPERCFVGEELPGTDSETTVTSPDGSTATAPFRTSSPGIYIVRKGGEERGIACNLPGNESRLEPIPDTAFASLGIAVEKVAGTDDSPSTGDAQRLQAAELEGHQKLWKWILFGLLVVLLVETWFANRPRLTPAVAR